MIGPCHLCKFWKYANTVHPGWGHCYAAQEKTEKDYYAKTPRSDRPKFVAIGSDKITGILATNAKFRCNEFQPKR